MISCCWYRTKALSTLNFLAMRNLTAEDQERSFISLLARHLFTFSRNRVVAASSSWVRSAPAPGPAPAPGLPPVLLIPSHCCRISISNVSCNTRLITILRFMNDKILMSVLNLLIMNACLHKQVSGSRAMNE